MLSRIRTTRTRHEPLGLTRARITLTRVGDPEPALPHEEEDSPYEWVPVDRRRFYAQGPSERFNKIYLTYWNPPVWDQLSPEEFAEDWRQVASLDVAAAADALKDATPEQRSLLAPVDLAPLLASDVPQRIRLKALRLLGQIEPVPAVNLVERGVLVNFTSRSKGVR
jgi:hypothetical protein